MNTPFTNYLKLAASWGGPAKALRRHFLKYVGEQHPTLAPKPARMGVAGTTDPNAFYERGAVHYPYRGTAIPSTGARGITTPAAVLSHEMSHSVTMPHPKRPAFEPSVSNMLEADAARNPAAHQSAEDYDIANLHDDVEARKAFRDSVGSRFGRASTQPIPEPEQRWHETIADAMSRDFQAWSARKKPGYLEALNATIARNTRTKGMRQ